MKRNNRFIALLAPVLATTMLASCSVVNEVKEFFFGVDDVSNATFHQFTNPEEFDTEGEVAQGYLDNYDDNLNKLVSAKLLEGELDIDVCTGEAEKAQLEISYKLYNDACEAKQVMKEDITTLGVKETRTVTADILMANVGEDFSIVKYVVNMPDDKGLEYSRSSYVDNYGSVVMGSGIYFDSGVDILYKKVDGKHYVFTFETRLFYTTTSDIQDNLFTYNSMVKVERLFELNKNYAITSAYYLEEKYVDHNLDTGLAFSRWELKDREFYTATFSYGTRKDYSGMDKFKAEIPEGYVREGKATLQIGKEESNAFVELDSKTYTYGYYNLFNKTETLELSYEFDAGSEDRLLRVKFDRKYKYLLGEKGGTQETFTDYITAMVANLYGLNVHTIADDPDSQLFIVLPAGQSLQLNLAITYSSTSIDSGSLSVNKF